MTPPKERLLFYVRGGAGIVSHDEEVNVTPATESEVSNAFKDLVGWLDSGATPVGPRDSWPL